MASRRRPAGNPPRPRTIRCRTSRAQSFRPGTRRAGCSARPAPPLLPARPPASSLRRGTSSAAASWPQPGFSPLRRSAHRRVHSKWMCALGFGSDHCDLPQYSRRSPQSYDGLSAPLASASGSASRSSATGRRSRPPCRRLGQPLGPRPCRASAEAVWKAESRTSRSPSPGSGRRRPRSASLAEAAAEGSVTPTTVSARLTARPSTLP
mmetsp:Transcript_102003/g.295164  ORF Transcript_102003/g.295164 Transcript_102003/m.295164 type:complete len:208 (+) Transcript_102003:1050-1673(+)